MIYESPMPLPLILHCPMCGVQHIDQADPAKGWTDPPHRSHLCAFCGTQWRPSDYCTRGVSVIGTRGKKDTWDHTRAMTVANDEQDSAIDRTYGAMFTPIAATIKEMDMSLPPMTRDVPHKTPGDILEDIKRIMPSAPHPYRVVIKFRDVDGPRIADHVVPAETRDDAFEVAAMFMTKPNVRSVKVEVTI